MGKYEWQEIAAKKITSDRKPDLAASFIQLIVTSLVIREGLSMPMTAYESEKFVGRSRVTIHKYVKAGLIGITRAKKRSKTIILYNAADLSIIFGKPLPPAFADEQPEKAINYSPAPRKKGGRPKGSRNKRWSEIESTHTEGGCEGIYRAGRELLKALAGACLSSGLTRDQVEARLCVLMVSLCEDLEATAHRAFDTHRLLSIADRGAKRRGRPRRDLGSVKHNPFMLSLSSQLSPAD
jgi:hypothetical protein